MKKKAFIAVCLISKELENGGEIRKITEIDLQRSSKICYESYPLWTWFLRKNPKFL